MSVRIGANPIGWSNDDMRELGGDTPLATCLAEAREAGFEGMELGHKFPRQPEALRAALAPYGLACISGWYSAELRHRDAQAELAHLRPHVDLLRAMAERCWCSPRPPTPSTATARPRSRAAPGCPWMAGPGSAGA